MKKVILTLIAVLFLVTDCYSEEYFDECKEYAFVKLNERYKEDFVYVLVVESHGPFGNDHPTFYVKSTNENSPAFSFLV